MKYYIICFLGLVCFCIGYTAQTRTYYAAKGGSVCYSSEVKKNIKKKVYFKNIQKCLEYTKD